MYLKRRRNAQTICGRGKGAARCRLSNALINWSSESSSFPIKAEVWAVCRSAISSDLREASAEGGLRGHSLNWGLQRLNKPLLEQRPSNGWYQCGEVCPQLQRSKLSTNASYRQVDEGWRFKHFAVAELSQAVNLQQNGWKSPDWSACWHLQRAVLRSIVQISMNWSNAGKKSKIPPQWHKRLRRSDSSVAAWFLHTNTTWRRTAAFFHQLWGRGGWLGHRQSPSPSVSLTHVGYSLLVGTSNWNNASPRPLP